MTRSTTLSVVPPVILPVIVVPNWNGKGDLGTCLDSLQSQSIPAHIIVVDNGSTDGSVEFIESGYPGIELIKHDVNRGYAGGVNPGFKRAIEMGAAYAAPFNNDAVADTKWLETLIDFLDINPGVGVAACKLLSADGKHLDSTGDYYTNWGLPYPRGRGESDINKYDHSTDIFAASGGASLYRVSMLQEVGLLDEDFFAYYEDVDLSFRAQLAGWKVAYVPQSVVYHDTGSTSRRMKGFTTYQTMKNQPLVLYKNVPRRYLFRVGWRFFLAHSLFFGRAVSRGQGWAALKGDAKATGYLFTKHSERRHIQKTRKVSDEYIWSIMVHDLPPNALALRKLRAFWWKITGKTRGEKT
jgi:GT2 family glycosyltransferase